MPAVCVCMEPFESRTLLAAGAVDASYSPPFDKTPSTAFPSPVVHMQFDGKSIHAAQLNGVQTLWRQKPNGALDKSFGAGGKVILDDHFIGFAIAPDGKIVVDYADRPDLDSIHIARFTRNGKP